MRKGPQGNNKGYDVTIFDTHWSLDGTMPKSTKITLLPANDYEKILGNLLGSDERIYDYLKKSGSTIVRPRRTTDVRYVLYAELTPEVTFHDLRKIVVEGEHYWSSKNHAMKKDERPKIYINPKPSPQIEALKSSEPALGKKVTHVEEEWTKHEAPLETGTKTFWRNNKTFAIRHDQPSPPPLEPKPRQEITIPESWIRLDDYFYVPSHELVVFNHDSVIQVALQGIQALEKKLRSASSASGAAAGDEFESEEKDTKNLLGQLQEEVLRAQQSVEVNICSSPWCKGVTGPQYKCMSQYCRNSIGQFHISDDSNRGCSAQLLAFPPFQNNESTPQMMLTPSR